MKDMATGNWTPPGQWVRVWTNQNPSADFAAQNIPLTIGANDGVGICFSGSTSGSDSFAGMFIARAGWQLVGQTPVQTGSFRTRTCEISTSGISVGSGYEGTTVKNDMVKPIYVYIWKDYFAS